MPVQISDVTVTVNDSVVAVEPNTVKFTEGKGEQSMRAASVGGGQTVQVFSNDVALAFSTVSFDLATTIEHLTLAKEWKVGQNTNVVGISGSTSEGNFARTITQAALTADYEVEFGAESVISIEFKGNSAI